MEWRYFLSATAQSMAAVIGIMGALLVALVLYEIRIRRENQFNLQMLLANSRRLEARMPPLNNMLEAFLGNRLSDTREMFKNLLLKEGGPDKSPEEYLAQMPNRVYKYEDPERVLNLIRNVIKRWEETDGNIGEGDRIGRTPVSQIEEELVSFEERYQVALHHVRSVNTLRSRIESSNIKLIRGVCIVLPLIFALTVGLPLFLIPSDPAIADSAQVESLCSPKPALLSIMLLTMTALGAFVWHLSKSYQYKKDNLVSLERFSTMSTYSKYFERAWLSGNDNLY